MDANPRVALIIGSGSVKCAAALGAWRVLQREGIEIDLLVGCSGGSLFASTMALKWDVEECIRKTYELWNHKVTQKRHWPSLFRMLLPHLFKFNERFGIIDDGYLLEALNSAFGDLTFEDVKTPLHMVATDFVSGESVTLSDGRLVDAMRASSAIPFIWSPWQIGERLLVDGALSNPMPLDIAINQGAGIILAMGFKNPFPFEIKSFGRFMDQINGIVMNNLFKANYSFHSLTHHAEIIPILPEFGEPVRLFDTAKIPYVIKQGEKIMEAKLPYLQQLLCAVA